jgi:hypothetical protein
MITRVSVDMHPTFPTATWSFVHARYPSHSRHQCPGNARAFMSDDATQIAGRVARMLAAATPPAMSYSTAPRHSSMPSRPDGTPARRGQLRVLAPRRSGSGSAMSGVRPGAAAVAAGNEVGITGARQCALLLCSARLCAASSAETRKFPGGVDVDAFLGVKGSPVQIRPSRLVVEFFRKYVCVTRANKRAILLCNGPSRGALRSGATASFTGHVPKRQSRGLRSGGCPRLPVPGAGGMIAG